MCLHLGVGTAWAGPGDHIQAGDATLIPAVDVGIEHRTNTFRTPSDPTGGTALQVVPSVELEAEGRQVAFSLEGNYVLRKFFQRSVTNLDRFTDFGVGARLDLLRESAVGLSLNNTTTFRSRVVERTFDRTPFTTQFQNGFDGSLVVRPGAVLEISLGGHWSYSDFFVPTEGNGGGTRAYNYRNTFGPELEAEWTFFPRTALVLEAAYGWNRWQQNSVATNNSASALGGYIALPDSQYVQGQVGLRGRIGRRMVLVAMLGYGQATYDEASVALDPCGDECDGAALGFDQDVKGLDGLLVTSRLTYELGDNQQVSLAYVRGFMDSWFTNYLAYDDLSATSRLRFGRLFGIEAGVGGRFEDYAGEVTRSDLLLRADGTLAFHLQDWGTVRAGARWDQRSSDESLVEFDNLTFQGRFSFVY